MTLAQGSGRKRESGRRRREAGFTLLELVITVATVVILAVMAFWSIGTVVPGYRLAAAAREVSNLLVLTRAKAISQNRHYLVEFQTSGYRVVWDKTNFGVLDAGDEVVETGGYGPGVRYQRPTTDPLPASNTVAFDPRGKAFNITVGGQHVQLTNSPTRTREIQVRYTGLVRKL